jgi:hypothetical protein
VMCACMDDSCSEEIQLDLKLSVLIAQLAGRAAPTAVIEVAHVIPVIKLISSKELSTNRASGVRSSCSTV